MLTNLKIIVFGLCVFASISSRAQQKDSARLLKEVIIEQSRLSSYAISQYVLPVDSMTRALASGGSLADMLRKFGYGHIRSYGPGGLATASLRGTGSSHTAVLWNGINLVSPLNGSLDLSLVPVSFIDDVSIQSGGAASLYGNGSIGGTIQLNNKASFNEGLKLKTFTNAGSFGGFFQDAGASWSGKKFITSTNVFYTAAKNDFEFINRNYYPAREELRQHTGYEQKGILQQNYWQLTARNLIHLKFWYQDNLYEAPNSSFVPRTSEATEQNKYFRTLLGWSHSKNNFDFSYQGAFIRHNLDYRDPVLSLVSPSTFNTFINNVEANFSFKKDVSLTTGTNYTWETGKVADYGSDIPVRNRIALVSAFKLKPGTRWEVSTSFREELINGSLTPFAPAITAKLQVSSAFQTYVNASRNYRIPTFNDLYWKGAGGLGNPDLKTEVSVGGETGFTFNTTGGDKYTAFSLKGAVFSNHVDNWIQWIPMTSSVWSPENIKNVWSRGLETQAAINKQVNKINFELSAHYSFTQSTNESIYENINNNELGKQLMFTPTHQGSASVRATWKGFNLNIINNYIGKQYTDSDNTEINAMKAYDIVSMWLSKAFSINHLKAVLSGELNNVLDTEYQSRPGYPMPGRNFKIGLTLNFNKPNSL